MADYRTEVLKQFVVSNETPTKMVNTDIIPSDVSDGAASALRDYHPRTGNDYQVICPLVGSGADAYLAVEPRGAGWNLKQIEFLRRLKFVPVLEFKLPNREPTLMMVRSGGGNMRLANTGWYLVNARLQKISFKEGTGDGTIATYNEVLLVWEYQAGQGEAPYLKPVMTCWKWASSPASA